VKQKQYVLWQDYKVDCGLLAAKVCNFAKINRVSYHTVIALPRGGMLAGQLVGYELQYRKLEPEGPFPFFIATNVLPTMLQAIRANVPRDKPAVLVDDIWDTGWTMQTVIDVLKDYCRPLITATVYWKEQETACAPDLWVSKKDPGKWLVLPFDND